jgi:hypothetical protein
MGIRTAAAVATAAGAGVLHGPLPFYLFIYFIFSSI